MNHVITEELIAEIERDTGFPFELDNIGDNIVNFSVDNEIIQPVYYTWNSEDYN